MIIVTMHIEENGVYLSGLAPDCVAGGGPAAEAVGELAGTEGSSLAGGSSAAEASVG